MVKWRLQYPAPMLVFFSLLFMLAACSQGKTASSTTAPQSEAVFQNPVIAENYPDPFVLKEGDVYWLYATNSPGKNISLASSADLVHWQLLGDALPELPAWAKQTSGLTWAPEVIKIGDQFVMYYTSRDFASDKQCVGVAVSNKPEGPFQDHNAQPLVCQTLMGGTIDASPYRDDEGKLYLYYKNDGNCCGVATMIFGQELAEDGLSLLGKPERLLRNDQKWEDYVIEAPTMFKHNGRYYLFFSANDYGSSKYAVGYADCESPLGPCEDAQENPILVSDMGNEEQVVMGPGHQHLLQVGDQTWIFYHAWEVLDNGQRTDRRFVWLDRLDWVDGKPVVRGPTTGEQSVPQLP
jgi:beta-xylosidase